MIGLNNNFIILFSVVYLLFGNKLTTANDLEETIKKLQQKCTNEIVAIFYGMNSPLKMAKKALCHLNYKSHVFSRNDDALKYFRLFEKFLLPGPFMVPPLEFCQHRHLDDYDKIRECIVRLKDFVALSLKETLIDAFYNHTKQEYPFSIDNNEGHHYMIHLQNTLDLAPDMKTPKQFCETIYILDANKILPTDLYVNYNPSNVGENNF